MATTDAFPWLLHGSDLKLSKMAIKRELPPLHFDIPIPPQPPKYEPGSGPPPPRIDLRLVHDTNAFIVDKIVLPLEPFTQRNDPRQRRAYYIIGWPDLPAARPVIAATSILDYVSPRTLEDWEYQDALRREEAREAEERAQKKGKALLAPGATANRKPGGKRKPGRPPKARLMDVPPLEPVLDSDQEEMLQRRKSGPSLSTPQKSRLARLVAEEEILEKMEVVEEEDPVSVIQRQLDSEDRSEGLDLDEDVNMEGSAGGYSGHSVSAVSVASGDETSYTSSSRPHAEPIEPADDALARSGAAIATTSRASPLTTSAWKRAGSFSSPSRVRAPVVPPVSNTPIPLPPYVSQSKKSNASTPKPKSQTKLQLKPVLRPSETSTPAARSRNPSSTSAHPEVYHTMGQRPSSSLSMSPSPGNGFTPIGGTFPRPLKRSSDDASVATDTPASTLSKRGRKRKQPKLSQVQPDVSVASEFQDADNPGKDMVQGDQDFVVKRLEGDYTLEGIHWYKVRWEGNWPPDQNPTWEPEENISDKLVREYLKRKAKREAEKTSKSNTPVTNSGSNKEPTAKRQSSLADWAKGYNSVTEAFEGKAELDATTNALLGRHENGRDAEDEGIEGHDELLVVERNEDEERETAAKERKKQLDAQLAAQFASMARGGPRQF